MRFALELKRIANQHAPKFLFYFILVLMCKKFLLFKQERTLNILESHLNGCISHKKQLKKRKAGETALENELHAMEIDLPSFQTDIILQSRIEQIFTSKQTMK